MALPAEFITLIESYGSEELSSVSRQLDSEPSVSVRVNRLKGTSLPADAPKVPWCTEGYYLNQRPAFTLDPALHQGRYYVQDASSMFISHVLRHLTADGGSVTYLDACAAPGGKTTAAIDALPGGSLVVANEYVASRAAILRENLIKWGSPLTVVTQGDTSRFGSHRHEYDIIAADVPCSGEGMMRKDPQAREQWSPELVRQCVGRQREIVENLWEALRPGGYFIYSTCTFNREENEKMVLYIMEHYGAKPVDIPVKAEWNITGAIDCCAPCYRFLPGKVRGEGLFMAVLQKPDGEISRKKLKPGKNRQKEKPHPVSADLQGLIKPGSAKLYWDGDRLMAAPETPLQISAGYPCIHIGTLKGKDLVPEQALAMSLLLNPEAFERCEVNRDTALDYLRSQAITLPEGTRRGIILLTYEGQPLGFVKNIGSRANNLYPNSWRVLK
ncbi:MAG: rRNA cytosine-C5-methyltransferase [Paramuribaculum sp.]|nr:rRNA cytosine-C5-methyltransferase [Paramuribaculum sp.]